MIENWKPIKNFENYIISSNGIVKRLEHIRIDSIGRSKLYSEKIIKPINMKGYCQIEFWDKGKRVYREYLHRLVYKSFSNVDIGTKIIDHINGDKKDNSINNLRAVTNSQNQCNNIAKGYTFNKRINKYSASITVNYKTTFLGNFKYEEDARSAYLEACKIYHKGFCNRKVEK